MGRFLDFDYLLRLAGDWGQRLATDVLNPPVLVQLTLIPVTFFTAFLLRPRLDAMIRRIAKRGGGPFWSDTVPRTALSISLPLLWFVFAVLATVAVAKAGIADPILTTLVRLLLAWILIRLAAALMRDPVLARWATVLVWVVAALNILGLLGPLLGFLDDIALQVGKVRLSLLTVLRGALVLTLLLWAATALSRLLERRIGQFPNVTPSVQVLFTKVARVGLLVLAFLVAMRAVGIDLTGLALFSGAVGLGLGFGMQKVVSNLVSGLILLLDRSVKPGDVIAIGGTYGWVNELGARYASVITRDGIEHLIPNEELITQPVENWSHSSSLVRLKTPIPVSYDTDLDQAIALCLEAAHGVRRVLDVPKPVCLLRGFGDSAVNLELRFWISDAQNGIHNVQSEVLLGVWAKFREHAIEIPLPKRDVAFQNPITVQMVRATTHGQTAAPEEEELPAAERLRVANPDPA